MKATLVVVVVELKKDEIKIYWRDLREVICERQPAM